MTDATSPRPTCDPQCTCPRIRIYNPHRVGCPRWDDDRAWSKQDREEQARKVKVARS